MSYILTTFLLGIFLFGQTTAEYDRKRGWSEEDRISDVYLGGD